jgi:hypothetical protein
MMTITQLRDGMGGFKPLRRETSPATPLATREVAQNGVISRMITFVCTHQRLRPTELISNRREKRLAHSRFAIMWAAKKQTTYSYPQIARALGGFDHTSVMHGVRRAEQLRAADPEFRSFSDALAARFEPESAPQANEEADPCLPL